jgi:hypothetical protein
MTAHRLLPRRSRHGGRSDRRRTTAATLSDGGTTVELSLDAAQATATEESASDDETETESTSAVGPGLGVGSAVAGAGALAGYKLTRDDDEE